MKDTVTLLKTSGDLDICLSRVDRSCLPGRFKAWIYQHSVLLRKLWPLLMYDILIRVIAMKRWVSNYLRRWLGFLRSLSRAALYGTSNKLQLPISRLSEEFEVTRTREMILYRDSHEPKIATEEIERHAGKKSEHPKSLRSQRNVYEKNLSQYSYYRTNRTEVLPKDTGRQN